MIFLCVPSIPEGKEVYRLHKSKERNNELAKAAKEYHLKNLLTGLSIFICRLAGKEFSVYSKVKLVRQK